MTYSEKMCKKVEYRCEYCDFKCSNKYNYNNHLKTKKHKLLTNTDQNTIKNAENALKNANLEKKVFICECGMEYKHKQSLYNHKKKCIYDININDNNYKELLLTLINENKEMRKMMQDQQKQMYELFPKIGNNNNNNTNNVKQKFNINVFLNEQCKDALTMNEFVDKIDISMKNLLITKDKGLGEGLSNIIIDNMNKLSLYERPMHCTDKKRETLYVKNEEWEKDDKKEQINKLLKNVEKKQVRNINQWTDEHPNYMDSELLQEQYINLVKGCTGSIDDCKDKVIRKVCDNVYLTDK